MYKSVIYKASRPRVYFVRFVLLFIQFHSILTSHSNCWRCCKSLKTELQRKRKAQTALCSGLFAVSKPECCRAFRNKIKQQLQAYQTLCSHRHRQTLSSEKCSRYTLQYEGSASEYAISKGGPSMLAMTVCFWIKTKQKGATAHYLSYAVPLFHDRRFKIFGPSDLKITIGDVSINKSQAYTSSSHNIKLNDGKWHHICTVWSSNDGKYSFYKDGNNAGSGVISSSIGNPLINGGVWVIGQDQGILGGGFDDSKSAHGHITQLDIWDRVLPTLEIIGFSTRCKTTPFRRGNVKSWNDFDVMGNVTIVASRCC